MHKGKLLKLSSVFSSYINACVSFYLSWCFLGLKQWHTCEEKYILRKSQKLKEEKKEYVTHAW